MPICPIERDFAMYEERLEREEAEAGLWEELKQDYLDDLFLGRTVRVGGRAGLPARVIDRAVVLEAAKENETSCVRAAEGILETHSRELLMQYIDWITEKRELSRAGL